MLSAGACPGKSEKPFQAEAKVASASDTNYLLQYTSYNFINFAP